MILTFYRKVYFSDTEACVCFLCDVYVLVFYVHVYPHIGLSVCLCWPRGTSKHTVIVVDLVVLEPIKL